MAKRKRSRKPFNLQRWLISRLRRLSYQVPGVYAEAKGKARLERGLYGCQQCGMCCKNGEYQLDHINPVIEPGATIFSWDTYISRLFVPASGLQLLCLHCHHEKTQLENEQRRK